MSLYNSLRMLFEDRLGGQLYRPIGEDWLHRGYWKMAEIYRNHPATIAQYLGTPLMHAQDSNGMMKIFDPQHQVYTRAITVEQFFNTKIDIVIATLPMHIDSFARLCREHPNHPKFIYQIGNAWNVPAGSQVKNVMASAIIHDPIPEGVQVITYHQEFDTKVFSPADYYFRMEPTIASFVNCFSTDGNYTADWQLFEEVERLMPSWKFKAYGGSCRDGSMGTNVEMANGLRDSMFVWHTKYGGDGYGHVIYNSAAVGRPMITKVGYYMGKMGMELMQDGVTCVGIDGLSPQEIVNKVLYYCDRDRYIAMCKAVQDNFAQKVNFDREFEDLQHFLKNLL